MRRDWTEAEIMVLKRNNGKKTASEIGEVLNRSRISVSCKALSIGINLSGKINRYWTLDEIRYLKRFARIKTCSAIAKDLNRTIGSIKAKAERDCIVMKKDNENHHSAVLSDTQVEMIRTLEDAGFRMKEIHALCFPHISYHHCGKIKRFESRISDENY